MLTESLRHRDCNLGLEARLHAILTGAFAHLLVLWVSSALRHGNGVAVMIRADIEC